MIALQAMYPAAGSVQVHDEQQRLQRIGSPINIIAEQIQVIPFFRGKPDLCEHLLKLRQCAVQITDHIG